jgi:hypothetical protein
VRFRYDTADPDPLARHDLVEIRQVPAAGAAAVHAFTLGRSAG